MATPEAVVEIGSTGIRLLVAEVNSRNDWQVLDRSEMPVSLGREVFSTGYVSRESLLSCIQILLRYKEQLAGWGITPDQVFVIATSSVREARNHDPLLDQIFIKTGFKVRIIDGIEENRLMFLAVQKCIKGISRRVLENDAVILDVGGGSSELMLMRQGKMMGAHSLKIGTVRVDQDAGSNSGVTENSKRYLKQFILNTKASLNNELNLAEVKLFFAVGGEARIAANACGKKISDALWEISRKDFEKFTDLTGTYSIAECAAKFNIEYSDAQQLHIGLLIYKMFIQLTDADKVLVPNTNIRDGVIISRTSRPDSQLQAEFYSQISASALNLLRKYHGDEAHALYVRDTSLIIFDALKEETGLDERDRMLLEVSCILHDIGMFIRMSNHQNHSAYIISNSEIFGLRKSEIKGIAEIARHHRGPSMPLDDEYFQALGHEERMLILKLTSILRIADALDRSHLQKLTDLSISKQNDCLFITDKAGHNKTMEKHALAEKGTMFEFVFGYKIILS
ncbi:MAG: HD domain-containing protein [Treponema sp.]|nr:HD domain-containing protein [Treponema sp.]